MDLIDYFIGNGLTFAVAAFPVILSIFLHRYCKVQIKYICFILILYIIIPIYVLYFNFSIDNLLYQSFSLLSSFIYLLFENLYVKVKNDKDNI